MKIDRDLMAAGIFARVMSEIKSPVERALVAEEMAEQCFDVADVFVGVAKHRLPPQK